MDFPFKLNGCKKVNIAALAAENGLDVSRIQSKLWQGSAVQPWDLGSLHFYGFTMIVLCAHEIQPKLQSFNPKLKVVYAPMYDDEMDDYTWTEALGAAWKAAEEITQGGRVLVTCQAGLNRSGLVVAMTAKVLNPSERMVEIIDRIRENRAPAALFNQSFSSALVRKMP